MASTEQRELDLVDKVNLRILNVANDGAKLTALLKVYLPPLLLKASSEHASVRQKVVLIASRLKTFIASPDVILPVAALLDQYIKAPQDAWVVRQMDVGFIRHSLGRISPKERRQLVPVFLKGFASDVGVMTEQGKSSAARFNFFLHTLKDLEIPPRGSKEDEAFRTEIGLDDPRDAEKIAYWLGQLLQLTVPPPGVAPVTNPVHDKAISFLYVHNVDETWRSPGGLDLATTRVRAVKLLESGAFTDEERFIPAVYAASHTDYRVNSIGDALLMRSKASLEDEERIRQLFKSHLTLSAPYRIRILGLLCKSAEATSAKWSEEIRAVVQRDIGTGEGAAAGTDAPADGLQLVKLHKALFEFVNWVARIGPGRGPFPIGPALIQELKRFIVEEQGWPVLKDDKTPTNPRDHSFLRGRAYDTMGVLAKGSDIDTASIMELVVFLFKSLSYDSTPDVVSNIEGALSILTTVYKSGGEKDEELRKLILQHMSLNEDDTEVYRSARHAATKWANLCLPFSDPIARWVDLIAVAGRKDERTEVIEEGQKGLDPWTYRVSEEHISADLPDWRELVWTFFKKPVSNGVGATLNAPKMLQNFTGLDAAAFPKAVTYCKRMLFLAALKDDFKIDPGWERQLEVLVTGDKQARETIRNYLAGLDGTALEDLLGAAFEGVQEDASAMLDKSLVEESLRSFVEIASLCPRSVLKPLAVNGLERLLLVVRSNRKEVRQLAARAIGLLGAHPAVPTELFNVVNHVLSQRCSTWKTAVGAEMNAVEGAFLSLGFLWSRATYYPHAVVEGDRVVSSGPPPLKRRKTDAVQNLADDTALALRNLSEAVGVRDAPDTTKTKPKEWLPPVEELAATGASGSLQGTIFDTLTQLWTASIMPEEASVTPYIDVLVPQAKKGNERAITALGRLAIGLKDDDAALETILTKLYELHELKQAEVHFSIGEAITAAIARWDSDIVQLTVDVESSTDAYSLGGRSKKIKEVLDKILTDCKATKPSLLKASGIWLFCIIQHCSHLPEIQSRLRECQVAFMRLLSARDELVQETASRGLSLVYEKGDPELKDALVKDLVGAFTGSATQLKVEEETELFEAGALPTGEGKSVTSYKDIVNLANEVGDQTLVYKFMSLASNAATWSTRSAFGRFGLSNILSESEVDPKLYPKLYRYRFDPNPNVQRSMNDIWKALVKNSNAVIDTHFDAIMQDLLKSVHGKEWRVRQASCTAISDLIGGRPFQQYEKYYAEIWTKALKVLDDVKGSVREQAMKLCMGMANTLTRQLEEGGVTSSAKDMMASTLPFLLSENGIESSVDEVKGFAITTVITITKTGGQALRPYIATIITHMLGLLSTIEPEALNYYYQRFKEDDRGKIDKIRSQMVNQSPIFQAIENCLRNVDSTVMTDLAAGLEDTIKTAIGMPTKLGCGRVLGTLATRHTIDFQPYASRFLQLLEKHSLDKNDEVSTGYARAAAYLMRHAPAAARERFVGKFTTLYFAAEDEARREKVAAVVAALSKISPDHFNALEASLLPFSYLGMHDTDTFVAKAFKDVWETHAGSARTVTRFVPEVVDLVARALDAPMWSLKHAGALTAGSATKAVAEQGSLSGGSVNVKQMGELWPVFDRALALKTFDGKEKLLEALADVHSYAKPFWSADAGVAAQLRKVVVREAKRNNESYRVHAFACLWKCAAARDDLEGAGMWEDVVGIVTPTLEEYVDDKGDTEVDGGSKKEGEDGKKSREKELLAYKTVLNAAEAVGRGHNPALMRAEPVTVLKAILGALEPFLKKRKFDSVRREVWYKCVEDLTVEAAKTTSTASSATEGEVARGYFATLDVDKPDEGVETQRLARANACVALVRAVKKGIFGQGEMVEAVVREMKQVVEMAKEGERSADVRKVILEALGEL